MNGAILLMAGSGERFGSPTPKQFLPLGGRPLFLYALDTLAATGLFDEILLVCHPNWISFARPLTPFPLIPGGQTRQESSYLGLKAFRTPPSFVLIHDAVRPFLTPDIIQANLSTAAQYRAADTCIPASDTLVYAPKPPLITSIPLRSHYLRGQTPQTFRYDLLLQAHKTTSLSNSSDDCSLVHEAGHPIHIVPGHERNFKITTDLDLLLAEQLLKKNKESQSDQKTPHRLHDPTLPLIETLFEKPVRHQE